MPLLAPDLGRGSIAPAAYKPWHAAVPQQSKHYKWGPWALGINFGKSKITDLSQAKDDYLTSLKLLIPYCDYAAINVSSPNTEGLRNFHNKTIRLK